MQKSIITVADTNVIDIKNFCSLAVLRTLCVTYTNSNSTVVVQPGALVGSPPPENKKKKKEKERKISRERVSHNGKGDTCSIKKKLF